MNTGLPDQLVVSISDIEMGAGGLMDDFPASPWLAQLIQAYAGPRFDGLKVEIVFNGDTFDLLKQPVNGGYTSVVTEEVALAKIDAAILSHPAFFDGIKQFLVAKRGDGAVHFVVGNHDIEIFFEAVQRRIHERIDHDNVYFPGLQVSFGDLQVEHGSQDDSMFRVEPDNVFVQTNKGRALRLPWGTVALLDAALPMHEYVYDLDRVKPRERVFDLLPDLRDVVVGEFWSYWKSSARDWIGADPVKQVSWTMLKEVAYRFRTRRTEIESGDSYRSLLKEEHNPRFITVGHVHCPAWWSHQNAKLLTTGCFRDECAIDRDGNVTAMIPKVYAEFYLRAGKVVRSHLVEVDGPPPPVGHFPTSVFDVLPRIRPLLASTAERTRMLSDEANQHAIERDTTTPEA